MKKFWIALVSITMFLGVIGCEKKETKPPVGEAVVEEVKEPEEVEAIETPTKKEKESESLGEPEEGKTPEQGEEEEW